VFRLCSGREKRVVPVREPRKDECVNNRPFLGLQVSKGKIFHVHTMKACRELGV
jgi:hypothetical protein